MRTANFIVPFAVILSTVSLAVAGASILRQPEPVAPTADDYYSLHAFDLAGDGYASTILTDLSKAECDHYADTVNAGNGSFLYVCRTQ